MLNSKVKIKLTLLHMVKLIYKKLILHYYINMKLYMQIILHY